MALNGEAPARRGRMMERVVRWTLNGQYQPPFLCTPADLEDLAAGHLLDSGRLDDLSQIAGLAAEGGEVQVTTSAPPAAALPIDERLAAAAPLASPLCLPLSVLRACCDRLTGEETYFGTHRIVLLGPDGELVREDIGRHNAADKAIGAGARAGWDMSRCALGATGRISLEILTKAAVAGIPILFTRKYASDLSDQWGERLNIAILNGAQGEAPEVTGAAWRITGTSQQPAGTVPCGPPVRPVRRQ